MTTMTDLQRLFQGHKACDEGLAWVGNRDLQTAWSECPNPEWMLWYLDRFRCVEVDKHRRFVTWCLRNTRMGDGVVIADALVDVGSQFVVKMAEKMNAGEQVDIRLLDERLDINQPLALRHASLAAYYAVIRPQLSWCYISLAIGKKAQAAANQEQSDALRHFYGAAVPPGGQR